MTKYLAGIMLWVLMLTAGEKIVVGVNPSAPFVMKEADGSYRGLAIDLWEEVARRAGIRYEYREFSLNGLMDAVVMGKADVGVTDLSITAEREKRFDFTHAYYHTGLSIAVPMESDADHVKTVFNKIFHSDNLKIFLLVILLIVGFAFFFWYLERKNGNDIFTEGPAKGFFSSLIWSFLLVVAGRIDVYDLKSFFARIVAFLLMFGGMTIIAGYTAVITTTLTVHEMKTAIHDLDDLSGVRVLVEKDTEDEKFLIHHHIRHKTVDDCTQGLRRLAEGEADAFVHDRDLMNYELRQQGLEEQVRVLNLRLESENYGFALAEGNPLKERIDRELLGVTEEPLWQEMRHRYLGDSR